MSKISKSAVFQKLYCDEAYLVRFCENAQHFLSQNQNSGIIASHGMDTMELLFDCSSLESLAQLRSKVLINKVVKSNLFVIPEYLPPTKAGTKFHSFRVYFQIMLWP